MSATDVKHGPKYRYDQGCRCDACREAKMAERRASRARARAANTPGYQRELALGRELKERYRGTCEQCGAPTTGCFGPGLAPALCLRCSARKVGRDRRGLGPTIGRVLDFIGDGERRFTEIHEHVGIAPHHAGNVLNRLVGYGLIVRVSRGVYRRAA